MNIEQDLFGLGEVFPSAKEILGIIEEDASRDVGEDVVVERLKVVAFRRTDGTYEIHGFTRNVHEADEMLVCAQAVQQQLESAKHPEIIT